jgi:putative endonuclease
MVKSETWYLYLLECEDGSLYTGIAKDVHDRFARHCAGKGARYTRARKPVGILGYVACPGYSAALKAEYAVKRLAPAEKWSLALSL